ncbi:hypothetical protein HBI70_182010 [Parastagonospora nodorum]|nr:hypothetical protein HBI70_182010 [Parastagonospora nodorum]KAH5654937.1 hypothetical protein HBI51_049820 [Parastagonospora nodorum]
MGKRRWARDDSISNTPRLPECICQALGDFEERSRPSRHSLQTIVSATCSPLYASPLSHPVPLVNSCKPAIYSAGSYPRLRPNKCSRERTATRV